MSEDLVMTLKSFISLCSIAIFMLICGMTFGFGTSLFNKLSFIAIVVFVVSNLIMAYMFSQKHKKADKAES